ncbi:protein PET100 homolog, mitochondrial [Chrysoperla carnea]|uniref:protein PET100 homolog, mitochondrial n=1 Tax=Chrysoperla carnea TaxID=189513 RepID=UPI001D07DD75|nr:protein PET100 homolog, mitochondrial [Chrysoperla carnea]
MGGWKLEVGRMAMYMAFPVAIFYYFNQPELFEDWVKNVRRDMYPPENKDHKALIEKTIIEMQEERDLELLKAARNFK